MRKILLLTLIILSMIISACNSENPIIDSRPEINFYVDNNLVHSLKTDGLEQIEFPNDPVKNNYKFMGWFFDNNHWEKQLTEDYYKSDRIISDIKVYAYFVRTYTQDEIYSTIKESVFKLEVLDKYKNVISQGSGFFVDEDGTMMTNAHVVEDAWYGRIDQDSSYFDIEITQVLHYNELMDYAILKVNNQFGSREFKPVLLSDEYYIGETVYNIGYPKDSFNSKITKGKILNVKDGILPYIVTDATIDNGSSGGITVTERGYVIGITSVRFSDGTYGTIPLDVFDDSLEQTVLFPKSLKDYFHPSTRVILNSFNFDDYFDISITRTNVFFSSSTMGTAYYSINITPRKDFDLSDGYFSISVSISIETKYTVYTTFSTFQYTDYLSSYINLYESMNFSNTYTNSALIIGVGGLKSIDTYSWNITFVSGVIEVYS